MKFSFIIGLLLTANSILAQDNVTVENIQYDVGDTLGIEYISIAMCIRPAPLSEFDYMDQGPMDSLAAILEANESISLLIEVHSDTRGSTEKNREWTQGRAEYFKRYLVHKGIDSLRLTAIGKGEDEPIFEEKYIIQFRKTDREKFERLHQRNRRTLFIITEN